MTDFPTPLRAAAKTRCLLCGRRPHVGGVFVPKDQSRVEALAGRVRTLAYTLCRRCSRLRDRIAQVEAKLFGEMEWRNPPLETKIDAQTEN